MAHPPTACHIAMLILLSRVPTVLHAFVSNPTSVNATPGSTVTFNCSATAGAVGVMVNGSLLTQLNTDNTDIRTRSVGPTFCLHILDTCTWKYSNTNVIRALAILGENGNDLYCDPVVLRVQGLLAAMGNFTVHSQRSSILLTWTPSFSLDIDPDFWYCVEVYNISQGRAPLSTNFNVYETQFYFTAPKFSLCNLFEFRVFAVNQVGNGSLTSVDVTFNKKPVFDETIQVVFFSILEITVNTLLSSYLDVCNGRVVATENITLSTIEGSGLNNLVVNVTDTTIQFNYNCTITTVSVSTPATITFLCVALAPNRGDVIGVAGCISEIVITFIVIAVIMVIGTVALLLYWKWKQHMYKSPTGSPESLQKTLPESATNVLKEGNTSLPQQNQNETVNKGYSNCDPDLENATEEEGDESERGEVLGPYESTDHLLVSQPQELQCLLGVSLPREFVEHAEKPFDHCEVDAPQEFIKGPLVQYTTETTVNARSTVSHIVTGSVIYIRKHNSSRTHAPGGGRTYSIQLPICKVPDTQDAGYFTGVDATLQNRDVYEVLAEDTNQSADDECMGSESTEDSNGSTSSASSPALNDMADVRDKG